jgi:lactoylglutathione lyase
MERGFKVLGIQQIALGSADKTGLQHLWMTLFGLPKVGTFTSERENVVEDILQLGTGPHAVEVDLMEPLDPEGKPAVHKPALNHVGLWVDDLEAAQTFLSNAGVRFTPGGIRQGASGHDVCFIHPKGNEVFPVGGSGVLIELVQAPEDVIAALTSD